MSAAHDSGSAPGSRVPRLRHAGALLGRSAATRLAPAARWQRLREKGFVVAQCALAAAAAWFIAADLLGHQNPFFAPIAAVIGLGTSYGQRLRRVLEVTFGVAVGVLLADLLVLGLGSGWWQIGIVVALAMSTALLLDAGTLFVTQAAVQSIIITAFATTAEASFTRWLDAVIGGTVAIVAAAVVPASVVRRPRTQAAVVTATMADLVRAAASCLQDRDVDNALSVLARARATEPLLRELSDAASEGLSVVTSSPWVRHRHTGEVQRMGELVGPLRRAMVNTRVLTRRVAVAAHRHEHVPEEYVALLAELAAALDEITDELRSGQPVVGARVRLLEVGEHTGIVSRAHSLSGEVVLAQVRSLVADLLQLSGMDVLEATDALPPAPG
ncbi:FUSC family protein [Nocardioidaceae bacterium]|nr:FUSC family protein [Nocardioidaceae bacterium]